MPSLDLYSDPVTLTRAICNISSVSDDETALADAIWAALQEFDHLELHRDGDTIVARTQLGRAQRVIIAGHLDTVPLNNNLPVRDEHEDGADYIWGRGTVDMKAGVAVQLHLAATLAEPTVDVTWMWYDHEEVAASLSGLTRLYAVRPDLFAGDFAVLGEPSNGAVEGGCNGSLRVTVKTRGVRAHSARSWMGQNAIHDAARVLSRLSQYEPEHVRVEGLTYREGLNAVAVRGGVAGNVIPDLCEIDVNYRFAPDKNGSDAEQVVRDVLAGFEVELIDLSEGARPGLDAPLAAAFIEAVGAEPRPKYGWTDVARFSALGVPAVNYGPGDPSLAHHDDERVPVTQIIDVERALRTWLSKR